MSKHRKIDFRMNAEERPAKMPEGFWKTAPAEWVRPHQGHVPQYVQYSGTGGTAYCVTCSCGDFTGPEHTVWEHGRDPQVLPAILVTEFRIHLRELGF
jgi:hypothetical protein